MKNIYLLSADIEWGGAHGVVIAEDPLQAIELITTKDPLDSYDSKWVVTDVLKCKDVDREIGVIMADYWRD